MRKVFGEITQECDPQRYELFVLVRINPIHTILFTLILYLRIIDCRTRRAFRNLKYLMLMSSQEYRGKMHVSSISYFRLTFVI